MAGALASTSTSRAGSASSPIELVQQALSANQTLQLELTKRAELLEAEIREADRLLAALEAGTSSEDAEDEVQIPGAGRISSLFPVSKCLDSESPLREEATKRSEFLSRISAQSFNPKQLEALKNAVRSENQRLYACHRQAGIGSAINIDKNLEGINWTIVAERVSDSGNDNFTADQCRIKWVGERHPRFNRSEWKVSETQKLSALVEAAMSSTERVPWVELAQNLGTDRTVVDVLNRGCVRPRHQWNSQYDELLLNAVNKFGVNNWTIVAREVSKYVTPTQCQNRYNKSLDPNIKRGAWTGVEDERLKKAVAAFGSAWVRVAEYVPGRTNDQCHERWTWHQNSNTSKNVWTEEEDEMLLDLAKSNGRQWKAISEKIGNGKTGPSCRIRFNKLTKAKEGTPASSSGRSPASMASLSPAPGTAGTADRTGMGEASTTDSGQSKGRGKKRQVGTESIGEPAPKKKKKAAQPEDMETRQDDPIAATASTSTAKPRARPRPAAKRKGKAAEQASTPLNTCGSEPPPSPPAQGESAVEEEEVPQGPRRSARRSTLRSEAQP